MQEAFLGRNKLVQDLKQHKILYELSKALHSTLHESKLSQLIVESISLIFNANSQLWLLDPGKETFTLKGSKPPTKNEKTLSSKWFEVLMQGRPIHYDPVKNYLLFALNNKNQPLGILEIFLNTSQKVSQDSLNFLLEVMDPIILALANAKHYSRLEKWALLDGLTGLFNRIYFQKTLGIEIARAKRQEYPLSLLMIDLDFFKHVNDTYGHPIGDEVLKRISWHCSHSLRKSDILSRYGGEEFIGLLVDCNGINASRIAEKIRSKIENWTLFIIESTSQHHPYILIEKISSKYEWLTPMPSNKSEAMLNSLKKLSLSDTHVLKTKSLIYYKIKVTVSIGIASYPEDFSHSSKGLDLVNEGAEEKDLLVYMADKALYKAKKAGRNKALLYQIIQKGVSNEHA